MTPHMCSISFLTLRSRATSTISNARSCRTGTSSSAAQRFEGLDRHRIIRGITSSISIVKHWIGFDALGREGRVVSESFVLIFVLSSTADAIFPSQLPMPSFDDDTGEDYRCYLHVHVCLLSTCKPQMLPRPAIRGSPSICGYIIVLTLKTIKKKKRTIDANVMPRRPALTMSAGVDRSAISSVYFVFFLLP
jgi:hypothetical protein